MSSWDDYKKKRQQEGTTQTYTPGAAAPDTAPKGWDSYKASSQAGDSLYDQWLAGEQRRQQSALAANQYYTTRNQQQYQARQAQQTQQAQQQRVQPGGDLYDYYKRTQQKSTTAPAATGRDVSGAMRSMETARRAIENPEADNGINASLSSNWLREAARQEASRLPRLDVSGGLESLRDRIKALDADPMQNNGANASVMGAAMQESAQLKAYRDTILEEAEADWRRAEQARDSAVTSDAQEYSKLDEDARTKKAIWGYMYAAMADTDVQQALKDFQEADARAANDVIYTDEQAQMWFGPGAKGNADTFEQTHQALVDDAERKRAIYEALVNYEGTRRVGEAEGAKAQAERTYQEAYAALTDAEIRGDEEGIKRAREAVERAEAAQKASSDLYENAYKETYGAGRNGGKAFWDRVKAGAIDFAGKFFTAPQLLLSWLPEGSELKQAANAAGNTFATGSQDFREIAAMSTKAMGDNPWWERGLSMVEEDTRQTLDFMMVAMLGGGGGASAGAGEAAKAAAAQGKLRDALVEGAKFYYTNPEYWSVFLMEAGNGYQENIKRGMTQPRAAVLALLNASVNAKLEFGIPGMDNGGLQSLYQKSGGKWDSITQACLDMLDSGIGEAKEELEQGIAEGIILKAGWNNGERLGSENGMKWFSGTQGEDAVFNTRDLGEAALAGGLMGFAGAARRMGLEVLRNSGTNYDEQVREAAAKYVQQYGDEGLQEMIRQGIQAAPENTTYHQAAVDLSQRLDEATDVEKARFIGYAQEWAEQADEQERQTQDRLGHVATDDETMRGYVEAAADAVMPEQRNAFVSTWNMAQTDNVEGFATEFKRLYDQGNTAQNMDEALASVKTMTREQAVRAYGIGLAEHQAQQATAQRGARTAGQLSITQNGQTQTYTDATMRTSSFYRGLNQQQKTAVDIGTAYSAALGVNVNFFQTEDLTDPIQGYYDAGTSTISINLNAGLESEADITDNSKYIGARILGHEITHFAEQWAPAEYDAFRSSVFSVLRARGVDVDALIDEQMARAEAARARGVNVTMSYDDATREVIADSMTDILRDSTLAQQMAQENPGLFKRIAKKIKELVAKIRKYFAELSPNTYEGATALQEEVDGQLRYLDDIVKQWETMERKAGENLRAAVSVEQANVNNPQNDIQYSIRSTSSALGVQAYRDPVTGQISFFVDGKPVSEVTKDHIINHSGIGVLITKARDNGYITTGEANSQYEAAADLMNMIMQTQDPEMTWAWAGASIFSALKKNSDGQYTTTIDFTTVCRKTQEMVTAMSSAMKKLGRGLTKSEVVQLQHKVSESGAEVPCPVCYVFSRWAGIGGMLDSIASFQDKYAGMSREDIMARTEELRAEIIKRGWAERTQKGGWSISDKVVAKLMGENDDKWMDLNAELESLEKTGKDKKRQTQLRKEIRKIEGDLWTQGEWTWVTKIMSRDDYKPVPRRILFDLDAGAEFAAKYPAVWAFRTTRGPSSGKAILPYSDMRLGDIILGADRANELSATKDKLYRASPFVDEDDNVILQGEMNDDQQSLYEKAVARMAAQNLIGGQRFQSTSDFRYDYALDYIQSFWELQAIGGKLQTYTKVVEFADMIAAIGGDVNLSVMPQGRGYKDGKLIYSNVTGMNIDAALEANRKFDNAQLILVGINDEHIRLALDDNGNTGGENVGFVIPYHASGASITKFIAELVQNLGEEWTKKNYQDYSSVQNDTNRSDITDYEKYLQEIRTKILTGKTISDEDVALIRGKSVDITGRSFEELRATEKKALAGDEAAMREYLSWSAGILSDLYDKMTTGAEKDTKLSSTQAEHIMPHEYWNRETTRSNAYVNGFIFRSYCRALGLKPRFTGSTGAKRFGDFSDSTGYWKTLIDRPMYANDGTYREQQRINVTNFDNAMLKSQYAEETYPNYKIQDPNVVRAQRVGERYAEELGGPERAAKMQFSLRTKPDPQKTETVYKLMRLGQDNKLYPLFIDAANPIEVGKWYDADSPDLSMLRSMPNGVYLVDYEHGTYQSLEEYAEDNGLRRGKNPNADDINKATAEGKRWIRITDTKNGTRNARYEENRLYDNYGINGSGSVETYAMRPGWHAGSLPTMLQIGKGPEKNLRDDTFVWVRGSVPADIDYQEEANRNAGKDIPTHIPDDGYYLKATNANKVASQADVMGWYVAGAFRADEIISDSEARRVIDEWNANHPNAQVQYDYERESGMDFDAQQMKLVPKGEVQYSLRNAEQTKTPEFKRWFGDWENDPANASKVVDEDGKPLVVYHGTSELFTVFDRTKGRSNMDIQGSFFSPWELDAEGYGPNVGAYYLNIRNPAPESVAYRALNRFKGQNNAGIKAREYLERLGYDGVNNGGEEYIAFYPEQIKSATDNVGTFDPQNPDIRYSLKNNPNAIIGVNINDSTQTFTDDILAKLKPVETREAAASAKHGSLYPYVGKRVGMVRTGKGRAMLVGWATVAREFEYTKDEFLDDSSKYGRHNIDVRGNEDYTWHDGRKKFGYVLADVEAEPNPYPITERGIVVRDVDPAVQRPVQYSLARPTLSNRDLLRQVAMDLNGIAEEAGFTENQVSAVQAVVDDIDALNNASSMLREATAQLRSASADWNHRIEDAKKARAASRPMSSQEWKAADAVVKELEAGKEAAMASLRKAFEDRSSEVRRLESAVARAESGQTAQFVLRKARDLAMRNMRRAEHEAVTAYRMQRDEKTAAAINRKYIQREAADLREWMLKPDRKNYMKHVPLPFQEALVGFLESIDESSERKLKGGEPTRADMRMIQNMNKLRRVIAGKDPDTNDPIFFDLPVGFADQLSDQIEKIQAAISMSTSEEGYVLNRMNSDQLKALREIIKVLKRSIKNFNAFYNQSLYAHVYEAAEDTMQTLGQIPKRAPSKLDGIDNYLNWQSMRPAYAFERFGQGGKAVWNSIKQGQDKLAFLAKEIVDFSAETFTEKEASAWNDEVITIDLPSGGSVRMTPAQIMSLYELNKRDQARLHLYGGGFRPTNVETSSGVISNDNHVVTEGDVNAIISKLTDRQREVADKLQQFMANRGGELGNEVSQRRFLLNQFTDEHYFPINSDGRNIAITEATEKMSGSTLFALINSSFTQDLNPNANNALAVYPIFEVYANHMADMAQYNAFALPLIDALKWLNYREVDDEGKYTGRSVRQTMMDAYGFREGGSGYAVDFVKGILQALNGTETQGSKYDTALQQALHHFNATRVAFNGRVVVQQPLAFARAALVMNPRDMVTAIKPARIRSNIEEMRQYSGVALWKSLGFFDVNISQSLSDMIGQKSDWRQRMTEIGLMGAEYGDTITWATMWEAAKNQARRENYTGEEQLRRAAEIFDEVVYKTQVVDSVLTKSEYMRQKNFVNRLFSSFMAEPVTTASMLLDAKFKFDMDVRKNGLSAAWKNNRGNIVRTALVFAMTAVLNASITAVYDAWRDDDDYETFWEKVFEHFRSNVGDELNALHLLPLVSDMSELVEYGFQKLTGNKDAYYNPTSLMPQSLDTLITGLTKTYDWIKKSIDGEKSNYQWYSGISKLVDAVSGLFGVPAYPIVRELKDLWNNTVGRFVPSAKVRSYDPGKKARVREAFEEGFLTAEEAQEELTQDPEVLSSGEMLTADDAYWLVRGWETGGESKYAALDAAITAGDDHSEALQVLVEHGTTEQAIKARITTTIKNAFLAGGLTEDEAVERLIRYRGYDEKEAKKKVSGWK